MPRFFLAFVVLILSWNTILAQQVLVVQKYACAYPETQSDRMLINGMKNEVMILKEGCFCDSLILLADSCLIKREACSFNISPQLSCSDPYDTSLRKLAFYLESNTGTDTLTFKIAQAPVPFFYVSAMDSRHGVYLNHGLDSLKSSISCFTQARVKSFCYEWIRGDSTLYEDCNNSNRFSEIQDKTFKDHRKVGDYIVLKEIIYTINDVEYILSPIYFMREVYH
ncbi:hypothetical protein GYB22_06030 [bacterium]|nr:hypothetical protein [bacterium]